MADTYADQMREIAELQQQIDLMQGQQDAREEKKTDVPAWLKVRKWAIAKGMSNLPTSKKTLLNHIKEADSLRLQLCRELPQLAAEVGLGDDDVEIPEILCDLISNPQAEPSIGLGRKLLEAGPINELIELAPQRKTTIRLAVQAWRDDQKQKLEAGISATKEAAARGREAVQERIRQHGNPLARSSAENVELRKRQILREAGLRVGHRK